MADDWGLATLIVAVIAVSLTLSPTSIALISRAWWALVHLVWPKVGRCESLGWNDIPHDPRPLHTCDVMPWPPLPQQQQQWRRCGHVHEQVGPAETIASFFTAINRGTFVRKPAQLNPLVSYIRTDKKTLRTLFSLLDHENIEFMPEEVDGIMTAVLKVNPAGGHWGRSKYRVDVTKNEMEHILRGYPPWYKSHIRLPSNRYVSYPARDERDLWRGGWVVAVGFSLTAEPVAAWFMESQEIQGGWRRTRKVTAAVVEAFNRILHCLDNLRLAFPGDATAEEAYSLMGTVVKSFPFSASELYTKYRDSMLGKGAGYESDWFHPSRSKTDFTAHMTLEQVVTAMDVFSHYDGLSEGEIKILRPVLCDAVLGAMAGVFAVSVHHFLQWMKPRRDAEELKGEGFVYLRQESSDRQK